MEFEGSQYVVYRHGDREHDHIHIVASRIRVSDGSTVSDSWDYRRSEKLIRELEQKYQLTPTPSSFESLRRGKTTGEVRQLRRTGKKSVKVKLQGLLDGATAASVTVPELIGRLQEGGIEVRVSYNRTGKVKGISYQLEGMAFSGTHLGKAYTFPGLQKYKNVNYQSSQDELIRLACARPLTQKTFSAGKQMEDNHLKLLYRHKYEQIKRRLKQELNWENPRELDRAIALEAFKETKDDYEVKATLSQSDVLRELKPEMSEEQYQEALWEYVQQLSREAEQSQEKKREGQEIER